jgi:Glycerophosphoryl diester phosphodiesterase family
MLTLLNTRAIIRLLVNKIFEKIVLLSKMDKNIHQLRRNKIMPSVLKIHLLFFIFLFFSPNQKTDASSRQQDRKGPAKRVTVIGHRGAAGLAPENTLSAFRRACEIGVDGFGAMMTADEEVVVHHDFRLKPEITRTADCEWLPEHMRPAIRNLKLAAGSFIVRKPFLKFPTNSRGSSMCQLPRHAACGQYTYFALQ